jgi:hypothetical protein
MLYRIRFGNFECYLARSTLESVMKVAHQKASRLPIGQKVLVFQGDNLVAQTERRSLFEDLLVQP